MPGVLMSVALNLAARIGLLLTGVTLLRRSQRVTAIALITLFTAIGAGGFDLYAFFLTPLPQEVPPDLSTGAAIGAFGALTTVAAFAAFTLAYIHKPLVRDEFGRQRDAG